MSFFSAPANKAPTSPEQASKAAVLPLVKKDGMPEKAKEIYLNLKKHFNVFYDEKGAVGRRYRRQDEAGTPYCITVDGQTLTFLPTILQSEPRENQSHSPKCCDPEKPGRSNAEFSTLQPPVQHSRRMGLRHLRGRDGP